MPVSVREFITSVETPGRDHRKHKPTALLEQRLIDTGIEPADLVRHVRNVEFDGTAATRLEVDEEKALRRGEQIAWMRLTVYELVRDPAGTKCLMRAAQRAEQHKPIAIDECRGFLPVRQETLGICDS